MFKMDKISLNGYGRACGHKSQCTNRPQTCINYWGKDLERRHMMEIDGCKVECCEKDFCHTPVEKRPKSPLRMGTNSTRVSNDDDDNGPNVGARGSGGTFEPHLSFLLIGVALFKSILHLCVYL